MGSRPWRGRGIYKGGRQRKGRRRSGQKPLSQGTWPPPDSLKEWGGEEAAAGGHRRGCKAKPPP